MSRARDLADLGGSADAGGLTGRNLIINGAFQCWQRSISVSSQTGSGYKTADRWYTNASGGTYNQSQQTVTLGDSAIGDFKYFLRHEVTTGDDFTGILYRIEDVQSVPEGTVTLSFYAKGTNPNSGHFEMIARQDFGTGGSPSSDVIQTAQDVTLTSSWQRFELQITVPSISGKTLGTDGNSYYQLQFTQPSDDDSSDAWTLDITGVQLEVGQTATPFEHRSFGDELTRCQRYFCKSYNYDIAPGASGSINNLKGAAAVSGGTSTANRPFWSAGQYPVIMRSEPTIVLYHYDGTSGKITGSAFATYDGSAVNIGDRGFNIHPTGNVSNSDDEDHYAIFTASAEL